MNSTVAYWVASDTAEICSCPTKFSITTSAEVTKALSRFCRIIGPVSFMIRPYTAFSFCGIFSIFLICNSLRIFLFLLLSFRNRRGLGGSKRQEKEPVARSQRRTGGSPGHSESPQSLISNNSSTIRSSCPVGSTYPLSGRNSTAVTPASRAQRTSIGRSPI